MGAKALSKMSQGVYGGTLIDDNEEGGRNKKGKTMTMAASVASNF